MTDAGQKLATDAVVVGAGAGTLFWIGTATAVAGLVTAVLLLGVAWMRFRIVRMELKKKSENSP